jgi:hypothetical protein
MVESIAKGYAERKLGIWSDVELVERGVPQHTQELDAVFYGSVEKVVEVQRPSGHVRTLDFGGEAWGGHDDRWQGPVLIDVVDVVENGKQVSLRFVRPMVGLQLLDLVDPSWIDANQASPLGRGLVTGELHARESMFIAWGVPSSKNELPDQIIESGTQVGEHVPKDQSKLRKDPPLVRRLCPDLPAPMTRVRWIGIPVEGDAVRATLGEYCGQVALAGCI